MWVVVCEAMPWRPVPKAVEGVGIQLNTTKKKKEYEEEEEEEEEELTL